MRKLITSIVAITASLILSVPMAQARINTTKLNCAQAEDLVSSRGAIVLDTSRNTFDRYVTNRSFCPIGDFVIRAYVPTRDKKSCWIGYTCSSTNPGREVPNPEPEPEPEPDRNPSPVP
jgi:hypothetical protein